MLVSGAIVLLGVSSSLVLLENLLFAIYLLRCVSHKELFLLLSWVSSSHLATWNLLKNA